MAMRNQSSDSGYDLYQLFLKSNKDREDRLNAEGIESSKLFDLLKIRSEELGKPIPPELYVAAFGGRPVSIWIFEKHQEWFD